MFGFGRNKKRNDVHKILQGRMNRSFVQQLGSRGRRVDRGSFCQVVWAVPCDPQGKPDFDAAYPAITRDICSDGLSLIQTAPIQDEQIVVGLPGDVEPAFLLCTVEHCTPLGYGFYQIGLYPEELQQVDHGVVLDIGERMKQKAIDSALVESAV